MTGELLGDEDFVRMVQNPIQRNLSEQVQYVAQVSGPRRARR